MAELSLPFESRYYPLKRLFNIYRRSLEKPEEFWAEQARHLDWFRTWDKVKEWDPPFARWFVGGLLNASHICVDYHVKTWRRSKVAIYWEGEPGDTRVLSYSTLYREVNKFASVLQNLGIQKGDPGKNSMVLNGHIDVVSPEPVSQWTHDPWGGEIVGNRLYGRGALDMKGGVAMMLAAFLRARAENLVPNGDIIFAALSDEEGRSKYGAKRGKGGAAPVAAAPSWCS
jgi:acetylornithine deacetylase/succinyl-diaminopimelate desuccinylase-like protein